MGIENGRAEGMGIGGIVLMAIMLSWGLLLFGEPIG